MQLAYCTPGYRLRANAAAAPPGVDPSIIALRAWSIAHGPAMLLLDRQVPADAVSIDAVVDARGLLGGAGRQ